MTEKHSDFESFRGKSDLVVKPEPLPQMVDANLFEKMGKIRVNPTIEMVTANDVSFSIKPDEISGSANNSFPDSRNTFFEMVSEFLSKVRPDITLDQGLIEDALKNKKSFIIDVQTDAGDHAGIEFWTNGEGEEELISVKLRNWLTASKDQKMVASYDGFVQAGIEKYQSGDNELYD